MCVVGEETSDDEDSLGEEDFDDEDSLDEEDFDDEDSLDEEDSAVIWQSSAVEENSTGVCGI